jgi:hypothetical protein
VVSTQPDRTKRKRGPEGDAGGCGSGGGESFLRAHWVAVPKAMRARRVNRRRRRRHPEEVEAAAKAGAARAAGRGAEGTEARAVQPHCHGRRVPVRRRLPLQPRWGRPLLPRPISVLCGFLDCSSPVLRLPVVTNIMKHRPRQTSARTCRCGAGDSHQFASAPRRRAQRFRVRNGALYAENAPPKACAQSVCPRPGR